MVPQVDDGRPHPVANALLAAVQDAVHDALDIGGLLHPVQPLAGVGQPIAVLPAQQIIIAGAP